MSKPAKDIRRKPRQSGVGIRSGRLSISEERDRFVRKQGERHQRVVFSFLVNNPRASESEIVSFFKKAEGIDLPNGMARLYKLHYQLVFKKLIKKRKNRKGE